MWYMVLFGWIVGPSDYCQQLEELQERQAYSGPKSALTLFALSNHMV